MIWLLAIFQSLFIWVHTHIHGMIALTHSIFWLFSLYFLFACVVCKCVTFLLLFVWYGFGVLGTVHIGESNFLSFDVCLQSAYSTMPCTQMHEHATPIDILCSEILRKEQYLRLGRVYACNFRCCFFLLRLLIRSECACIALITLCTVFFSSHSCVWSMHAAHSPKSM